MNRRGFLGAVAATPVLAALPVPQPAKTTCTLFNPDPGDCPEYEPGKGFWALTKVDQDQGSVTFEWRARA